MGHRPDDPFSAAKSSKMRAGKLLATWIPIIVGLVTFVAAVVEYAKAQQWKRAEFVAEQVEKFEARPAVKASMQMLDSNEREIDLPGGADSSKVRITDDTLAGALIPHTEKPNGEFTDVETRIRDSFDQFFDGLDSFDNFIESGLVSDQDVTPYLDYWLELIGDPKADRKPPAVLHAIWRYLGAYHYDGVVSLLKRHGYSMDGKAGGK